MASEPTVCAVMLTRDRPAMARRAVECFRRQTYERKWLVAWDSGLEPCGIEAACGIKANELWIREKPSGVSIGTLRNAAILVAGTCDIIVHFDDDDWSHPAHIADHVSLLKVSGAAAVGCNEMLFWREAEREAWLYRGSILGTSLCYWRETWEGVPFRATRLNPNHQQGTGEDADFLLDLAAKGMRWFAASSFIGGYHEPLGIDDMAGPMTLPRMIAGIHGANTSGAYDPAQMRAHPQHWTRVPAWDQFCLETMKI